MTTLDISDALFKEIRERSEKTGQPFPRVVKEILEAGLAHFSKVQTRRKYRVPTHDLKMKPGFRNLSMNQAWDQ
ncbi:MAG TPA: hypothetical protein EYQ50_22630 [Verrucomicrobiales bacterium]|nr:hypothetical protein [Verrucomicrobiales bacterium]HIL69643.1 hypothetical protein [Verrucomicrobiota bacterium]